MQISLLEINIGIPYSWIMIGQFNHFMLFYFQYSRGHRYNKLTILGIKLIK